MKVRLDQLLLDRQFAADIENARAIIGAGEIYVNDRISDKAGKMYDLNVSIRKKEKCPYVSRGGLKLEKGLDHFNIKPENLRCVDIGASSGGFTDCLLQHNPEKIYAVDVAYGQLAWKIRQDPRVVVLERFNARGITLKDIDNKPVDLAVIDVSFISLKKIIPCVAALFNKDIAILALIKPQFELKKEEVGIKGVVIQSHLHQKAIDKIADFICDLGLSNNGTIASPLLGPKGNREFLMYIRSSKTTVYETKMTP